MAKILYEVYSKPVIMSNFKEKFGRRLKKLRKNKGLTQEQLSEIISIEPPNISKIESGTHFPQPEKIEKIAKALDIQTYELFDFEECLTKEELLQSIISMIENFEVKKLEFVYKIIYNLNLFKK